MARVKKIDMTGVESFSKCSEGIHTAKAVQFDEAVTQNGDDMIKVTLEVISGPDKGCRVFDNFVLTDKALWKLKQYLTAVGVKAEGKIAIDLDKLVGKVCDIEVFHEEYNGVERAKVGDYKKLVRSKPTDMDDYEDIEDDEEEEVEEQPKAKPARKEKPAPKPAPKKEEDEEDWDEWSEDEDEEEAPPAKAKPGRPAKKEKEQAPKSKSKGDDDEDDDDEWDDWEDA